MYIPPLSCRKASCRNLFMKKLARERVVICPQLLGHRFSSLTPTMVGPLIPGHRYGEFPAV